MNKDNKIVPELRFPEFVNAGEWEIKEVGEIFDVTRGYVLAMSLVQEKQSDENPYPVFSSQTKNKGLAGFYKEYLYEDAITWTTDGANAGDVNYRSGKFYCTNVCGVLLNKKGFVNKCVSELINSVSKNYVSYVGNPKLMNGVMSKIKIPIPYIKEQQKIGSCLSSLDELIAAHTDKLETLKDHKKGLMQQLFPAEGEAVPKLRFKEFEKDGEWMEKTLGNMTEKVGSGTTPLGGDANYKKDGRPFVRSQNVGWGVFILKDIAYIDEQTHHNSIATEIKLGDVLLNITGASIGRSAIVDYRVNGGNVNQHVCIIRTIKDILFPAYLNQYLISSNGQKQIDSYQAGGNRQGLNFAQIRAFLIPIPPTKNEQQKIANFLSSIDDEITALAQKIEGLKEHKKGLMQGLFPNINE